MSAHIATGEHRINAVSWVKHGQWQIGTLDMVSRSGCSATDVNWGEEGGSISPGELVSTLIAE